LAIVNIALLAGSSGMQSGASAPVFCLSFPLYLWVVQDTGVDMDIQGLSSWMDNLTTTVQNIQDFVVQNPMSEPRIPIPDLFFGDRSKFLNFKNNCKLFLALKPRSSGDPVQQVRIIISLLRGDPQDWAFSLAPGDPALRDVDAFFLALGLLYDEPNTVDQAEKILLALCQGQDEVEIYCQKFRKWSVLTQWNECALAAIFRKGLSEAIKDVMVGFPMPASLNESMSLAIQIDRRLLPEFLSDYRDVFDEPKASALPPHRDCDCAINLIPGSKFPKGRLFNLSVPEHAAMRSYINESLEKGHIRPSSSPLGAGFFFVAKTDGSLRLCIDYRLLNKITVKFQYPLPLLSDLFARIKGASWFTKIDLRGAYNLVRIKQGDEWKTAFNMPEGHFEYLVMPFGLSNAPSVFQSFMHDIFRDYLDRFPIVYLDDILVFSDDWESHVKQMDPVKVQAIYDWTQPTFVKSLQKFLGFANFYRRYIANFSSVAKPLTDLTKKGADVVEVDASEIGARAVLSQRSSDGSVMKPCAFFSRKFSPAERNYDVGNRELLAMKWAFEEWRHWLEGAKHRVVVLTDHKNLTYLESAKRLNPRQARWSLFISRFDFVVSYLPGSKNVKADALSRSFVPDSPGVPEPAGILKEGHVVRLHGIPENIVSDRGSKFVSRFWRAFCARMGIDLSFSSAFHPQTNGQTERTNQTLETYLRCFVSADQDDWVSFLPLAEFALNNRASSVTLVSPFFCNSGFHPRFSSGQVESSDCPGVDTVVDRLQQIWTHVVDNLTLSQEKAQRFANRHRCVGPRLRVGDLVWLSSRYVPMKVSSPKFKPRFIGPYRISEVLNPVSFRLTLPASFAIHNVFHRSLLRRYVAPVVPSVDPPAPVLVEGELEYVVEKILDSRISRRKLQYLVKWKGYGQEDNSWVFASDVHAADLVPAFHLAHPGRPGGSGEGSLAIVNIALLAGSSGMQSGASAPKAPLWSENRKAAFSQDNTYCHLGPETLDSLDFASLALGVSTTSAVRTNRELQVEDEHTLEALLYLKYLTHFGRRVFSVYGDILEDYEINNHFIVNQRLHSNVVGYISPEMIDNRNLPDFFINDSLIQWKTINNEKKTLCLEFRNQSLNVQKVVYQEAEKSQEIQSIFVVMGVFLVLKEKYQTPLVDNENCRKCPDHEWSNENKTQCVPKLLEFLSYSDDGIPVIALSGSILLLTVTAVILGIFFRFQHTPIVRANNKNLSFILLISIMLTFLCVFLFLGRPVDSTCMLRQICTGLLLSISISSLLAKTIMVYIAFKATKPGSVWRAWTGVKLPNCVLLICTSVQVVICMSWVTLCPPFQELDTHSYTEKIIVQCNEGSDLWFYSVLGYMGILAAVSFITAFLARTLPDSFNEAKYITFSMLVFCSVWIAMIPAYLSTRSKYTVAVEMFAILTSNAGLLGCIFFPKCYIIFLQT
ncbi:unnamed protein product, partial [Ranitomeya imitator]